MEPLPSDSAQNERRALRYATNRIPWFVRLIWLGFWTFAIYYTVKYLFPDLQLELRPPQ